MSVIVFEQVSKRYGSHAVVADCSLTVEEGQFVVLLGPSGSGKTTLLRMVNRIIEPTSGRILVNSQDIQAIPETELRRHIGYVIQQVGLFPHMTVEANIAVVPKLLHWDKRRIDARIDTLLDLVSLPPDEYRKRRPRQLSGGQQQRVGIARAMAADPPILLMDEPFGAIDAITRTRLQDELLQIQSRVHKTVLFVTHDVEEALKLADVLVVMAEGRIAQAGPPREILAHPATPFVAELVGAGDILRQLSLVPVTEIMQRLDPAHANGHRIGQTGSARDVLALLLGAGASAVTVVGDDGNPLGMVTLEAVQTLAEQEAPAG